MKKLLSLLLVACLTAFAIKDSTYMRVNDAVITQSEYDQYKQFVSKFVPQERLNDQKAFQEEVNNYITELMIVKSEAKQMGHEISKDMKNKVLVDIAKNNGITLQEVKDNLKKDKVNPELFAEYQLLGQVLSQIVKERFEAGFSVAQKQIKDKQKELTHKQADLNMAVVKTKIPTVEEKKNLKTALEKKANAGNAEFMAISWQPIKAFPEEVQKDFSALKDKAFSSAHELEGRTVMFQLLAKRDFVPTSEQIKNALLGEYLMAKQKNWMENKKSEARIITY